MKIKKFIHDLFDNASLSDAELSAKLFKVLAVLVMMNVVVFVSVFFFAPTIGSFFGLLSVHRNDKITTPTVKPNPPTFQNLPASVNDTKITITGYGVAGGTVKLYVNGPQVATTVIGDDGMFTLTDVSLIDGRNTMFAKVTDKNGLTSDTTQTYTITVDNSKPKIEFTNLKDGDTIRNLDKRIDIQGTVNKNVTMTINGNNVIIKPDLTFEYILGVQEGDVTVKVDAVDEAGNKAEETLKLTYVKAGF
jgi:VCBS repeat-containing protein